MRDRLDHELSEFLDGRLPSGRREQLLDRIADDPETAQRLRELEAARALARELPTQAVGPEFTETLWERIRAGEGSPEAVFRTPLPWTTKVRYVATGAAAAALVLTLANFAGGRGIGEPGPDRVAAAPAGTEVPSDAGTRGLRPYEPSLLSRTPVLAPLRPETVAQAGQFECVEAVSALQSRTLDVVQAIDDVDPREVVVELDPFVGRARGSAEIIRWMQRADLVKLQPQFDTTLALTERILERFHRANSQNDAQLLRVAVEDLQELEIEGLRQKFDIVCCTSPEDFLEDLHEQIQRSADVRRALRFVVTGGTSGQLTIDVQIGGAQGLPFGLGGGEPMLILQRFDALPTAVTTQPLVPTDR
ncbi:MAG: hypothetical protein O2865_02345 [Planctomycetota bacterium]|nr:hypothetical protein [Planctomycetota bacterium]MDA0933552.1 hypothetical protein [Planctomycetota bacterium]MDA1221228.1 hypothetical protein [Planctomycetota bacterium]